MVKIATLITIISIIATSYVLADCGCLKCNKGLRVVSPPCAPLKIIYRGEKNNGYPCPQPIPYTVQTPICPSAPLPILRQYDYKVCVPPPPPVECNQQYAYPIHIEAPCVEPPKPVSYLKGLVTCPDRVVLPAPECEEKKEKAIPPSFVLQPIFKIEEDITNCGCQQRYVKKRVKRGIWDEGLLGIGKGGGGGLLATTPPIMRNSLDFVVGLLPAFLGEPLRKTLGISKQKQKSKSVLEKWRYRNQAPTPDRFANKKDNIHTPTSTGKKHRKFSVPILMTKLRKLTENSENAKNRKSKSRTKRSLILRTKNGDDYNSAELQLPFFRVKEELVPETDVEYEYEENSEEENENEDYYGNEDDDENENSIVGAPKFLQPFNFDQILPKNPMFYLLNTPVRVLHHFHKFGQQISPMFKTAPRVLATSRQYLRTFGKNFKRDILDLASNLVGDFHHLNGASFGRYRRSVDQNKRRRKRKNERGNNRNKRYVLRVVDEDEIEEYLRERFATLVQEKVKKAPKNKKRKRLTLEKLNSKIVIDNNGRPFVEIDGAKRPLRITPKIHEESDESEPSAILKSSQNRPYFSDKPINDEIATNLNELMKKINKTDENEEMDRVPMNVVRRHIETSLAEIHRLVTLVEPRSLYARPERVLHDLETQKNTLIDAWKRCLIGGEKTPSVALLEEFKLLDTYKNEAIRTLTEYLSREMVRFMAKRLLATLVRVQKLQCALKKALDEFGGSKGGIGGNGGGRRLRDEGREIKLVDAIDGLKFEGTLLDGVEAERELEVEKQMALVKRLRNFLVSNCKEVVEEFAGIVWEAENAQKMQKKTIEEMCGKFEGASGGDARVRKEMRIVFDLEKELELCEERQQHLLDDVGDGRISNNNHRRRSVLDDKNARSVLKSTNSAFGKQDTHENRDKRRNLDDWSYSKAILEDKKPVNLITNGYSLTAYKTNDDVLDLNLRDEGRKKFPFKKRL